MSRVLVIPTGVANTASVLAAFRRLNVEARLAESPEEVLAAEHVFVPGVGAFGQAIEQLSAGGYFLELQKRLTENRSTLLICLGLQLLFSESEESPGVQGLGIIPGSITRFSGVKKVPQLGWNWVNISETQPDALGADSLLPPQSGYAYFANSFKADSVPDGWQAALTHYGAPFVAALSRGNILACQFHPELSGRWGENVLLNWLSPGTRRTSAPCKTQALTSRIIPCLDVHDGRVVKGVKFAELRDSGSPVELAALYEAQGADELVILDISATPEGRGNQLCTVEAVRKKLRIPLTVGGGVRSVADALALLQAGADKVAINTAAVENPELVAEISRKFGAQCTVVAIDAAMNSTQSWEVVTRSGKNRTGIDVIEWAKEVAKRGAGEILLTSFDRDGTKEGYDTTLLKAVSNAVTIPIIASGGASNPKHLTDALLAGADAVLAASIFHFGEYTVQGLKAALTRDGVTVRNYLEEEERC